MPSYLEKSLPKLKYPPGSHGHGYKCNVCKHTYGQLKLWMCLILCGRWSINIIAINRDPLKLVAYSPNKKVDFLQVKVNIISGLVQLLANVSQCYNPIHYKSTNTYMEKGSGSKQKREKKGGNQFLVQKSLILFRYTGPQNLYCRWHETT